MKINSIVLSVFFLVFFNFSINLNAQTCELNNLFGWASENGGTTGGAGGKSVTVSTITDLNTQAQKVEKLIIYVNGNLTGAVSVKSNKTIFGLPGAKITGKISISGATNVIVRNLIIRGNPCSTYTICRAGDDGVSVTNSSNIWLDHLDIADGQDGNCDITSGSDFVTVSFCKFWYTYDKEHRFSNLNSSADDAYGDRDKLRITFHHNWWADRIVERQPRVRFGKVHVANNLYTSTTSNYIVGVGFEANMLVEGNILKTAAKPYQFFLAAGNFTALQTRNNIGPDSVNFYTQTAFLPPYTLTIDNPSIDLETKLTQCAGATLSDPMLTAFDDEFVNEQQEVFPNPFNNELNVNLVGVTKLTLFNASGHEVNLAENDFGKFDVSHLPIGLYFLTIEKGVKRQIYKLSKNN